MSHRRLNEGPWLVAEVFAAQTNGLPGTNGSSCGPSASCSAFSLVWLLSFSSEPADKQKAAAAMQSAGDTRCATLSVRLFDQVAEKRRNRPFTIGVQAPSLSEPFPWALSQTDM